MSGAQRFAVATIAAMLAANVWHWWIGVILVLVALLAIAGLVGLYLKMVSAPQHPNRRQQRHLDNQT